MDSDMVRPWGRPVGTLRIGRCQWVAVGSHAQGHWAALGVRQRRSIQIQHSQGRRMAGGTESHPIWDVPQVWRSLRASRTDECIPDRARPNSAHHGIVPRPQVGGVRVSQMRLAHCAGGYRKEPAGGKMIDSAEISGTVYVIVVLILLLVVTQLKDRGIL